MKKTFFNTTKLATILFAGTLILNQSCKKDEPQPATIPTISSVNPNSASVGETVTITGSNFKDGTSGVSVSFEGTTSTLTSATPTNIICAVPQITAGTADIVVTIDGKASSPFTGFEVTEALPVKLTGFTPDTGRYGHIITLTGENFGTSANAVTVTVNGKEQIITEITDTQIKIELAKKTWSGEVKVEKGGVSSTATNELTYYESYSSVILVEDLPGNDIAYYEGKYYLSDRNNRNDILVLDENYTILDTIAHFDIFPTGLFINNTGIVYFGSYLGMVCSFSADNYDIDTIIPEGGADLELQQMAHITGDNNGKLYVATNANGSIVEVDINGKTTTELFSETWGLFSAEILNNQLYYTHKDFSSRNLDGSNKSDIALASDGFDFDYSAIEYHPIYEKFYLCSRNRSEIYTSDTDTTYKVISTLEAGLEDAKGITFTPDGDLIVVGHKAGDNLIKILVE